MKVLWRYLKPQRKLIALALLLAGASQVLALVDPIIFGWIIDDYAIGRAGKSDDELIRGALGLLALAVLVAVLSRLAKAFQEYVTRLVVQKFGAQIFNDGLRQTLRLRYQEFEDQPSGETLALLLKVRTDTERFINAFINTVFASLVGMAFLAWYALTRHWALVPVFLIGVLVLGGFTGLLSRQIRSQQRSIVRETGRNAGFITEALRNIELIRSLGPNNRFLFRGQLGRTVTDEFSALPPSLRFFAGGDRSIRGYGYQEVGPRETNALGTHVPTGGKNLLTGSAEYERMFTPSWGAAAFVDAGNAFNEVNEGAYVGAGLGVRWRSPVGMVRFDLAHGFKDADNSIQIHINIGPDL